MIIYRAILPDNKCYVGCTNQTLEIRSLEHHLTALKNPKSKFHKAIIKFGFENIKWEILKQINSKEEGKIQEEYFIKVFNSCDNGYNSNYKGYGYPSMKGEKNPMFGKPSKKKGVPISNEQKQKLQEYWNLDKRTQLSKKKGGKRFRVIKIKIVPPKRSPKYIKKQIKDIELIGEWDIQQQCSKDLNIHVCYINKCLKGTKKTYKGYRFEYV